VELNALRLRPKLAAAAAVIEILLGLFALVGGVGHLLLGFGGLVSFSGSDVTLGNVANALGDLFTVEGLILLIAGFGLWTGSSWGWKLSFGIVIVGVVTSVPVLALGSVGAVPALIVNFVLLYVLWRKDVRAWPKGSPTTSS
jgi:hypothetical protein